MPNQNKADLFPPFAEQIILFEQRLRDARLPFYLFMGLRTFAEQNALYAQGRTTPGKIVTNARGGESWHCFGLAADYVLDGSTEKPGMQWSWDLKSDVNHDGRSDWVEMAKIAVECGLEAGLYWPRFPDAPHVQNKFGLTLHEANELYRSGGLNAVWNECRI